MIISGVKCDICNRTDVGEFTEKNVIEIVYKTKGWVINDLRTICPLCKIRENVK